MVASGMTLVSGLRALVGSKNFDEAGTETSSPFIIYEVERTRSHALYLCRHDGGR